MMYDDSNIFARILREEIPCDKVYENDYVLAFRDINPQASVHILVIPKGAYTDVADFSSNASVQEVTAFWSAIPNIVQKAGVGDTGFRVIANTGRDGGQEVPHFHVHVLGGEILGAMLPKK